MKTTERQFTIGDQQTNPAIIEAEEFVEKEGTLSSICRNFYKLLGKPTFIELKPVLYDQYTGKPVKSEWKAGWDKWDGIMWIDFNGHPYVTKKFAKLIPVGKTYTEEYEGKTLVLKHIGEIREQDGDTPDSFRLDVAVKREYKPLY